MRAYPGVLAAVVLATIWTPKSFGQKDQSPSPKPPSAVDAYGDPLPEGARARLGTLRFRFLEGINTAALSPDGKIFAAADYQTIYLLDTATGREVRRFTGTVQRGGVLGTQALFFSADGKTLACLTSSNAVQRWEAATGKALPAIALRPPAGGTRPVSVAFAADGKTLAVGYENLNQQTGLVQIFDADGKELHALEVLHNYRANVALSADGQRLLTWGQFINRGKAQPNAPQIQQLPRTMQLWNVADGKERHRFTVDQAQIAAAALSPDGKQVAIAGGVASVFLYDAENGQELRCFTGRRGNPRSLTFSPDGKRLALASAEGLTQVWDLVVGQRLSLHEGPMLRQNGLAFTLGGAVYAWGIEAQAVALWEVGSGKMLSPEGAHLNAIASLVFVDGGKELHSASFDGSILVWDVAEAKLQRAAHFRDDDPRFGGAYRQYQLSLSPDGRYLLGGVQNGNSIRLWDRTAQKAILDFEVVRSGLGEAISSDGRLLAFGTLNGMVDIWDAHTGQRLHRLKLGEDKRVGTNTLRLSFAPQGKKLAAMHILRDPNTGQAQSELIVVRTDDGKELCRVRRANANLSTVAFSADGQTVALAAPGPSGRMGVELRDADSGREIQRLELPQGIPQCLAFAPNGRTLAAGMSVSRVRQPDGTFINTMPSAIVWELATGQLRFRFAGHTAPVSCLAYAPDGRTLATGSADTTVLLWDLTGKTRYDIAKNSLAEGELAALWEALAAPDGARGFGALARLQSSPERALALLGKNLSPVKPVEIGPEGIAQLIAQLSDSKFEVRDRAHKRLEELSDEAAEPLRKALAAPESEEQRRRIEKILEKLDRRILTPDEVRQLRAIEVLEHLATPAARELLSRLAEGAPSALQTREARAARARLEMVKR